MSGRMGGGGGSSGGGGSGGGSKVRFDEADWADLEAAALPIGSDFHVGVVNAGTGWVERMGGCTLCMRGP
eukprot:364863-Chlamydomonas_euryale.AAC.3